MRKIIQPFKDNILGCDTEVCLLHLQEISRNKKETNYALERYCGLYTPWLDKFKDPVSLYKVIEETENVYKLHAGKQRFRLIKDPNHQWTTIPLSKGICAFILFGYKEITIYVVAGISPSKFNLFQEHEQFKAEKKRFINNIFDEAFIYTRYIYQLFKDIEHDRKLYNKPLKWMLVHDKFGIPIIVEGDKNETDV